MNFHTIIHRELLIGSKRSSTFYLRSLIAACGGIAAVVIIKLVVKGAIDPDEAGRTLLWTLAAMGMTLALAEGILLTVDSVARERREGTLGLLFLSNLTGYDVVVGKAGGAGLRTLFGLIAASPAPALTFLFGGVTLGDYFKVVLTLMNALFFALSLGIFISCLSENRRHNSTIGLVLMLWFLIGAPASALILKKVSWLLAVVTGVSPAAPLLAIIDPAATPPGIFVLMLCLSNFLAWLLLFGAGNLLNRNWRTTVTQPNVIAATPTALQPITGNPVLALAQRRGPMLKAFWTSCALVGIAAAIVALFAPSGMRLVAYGVMLVLVHIILSLEVSASAAKALAQHRASGLLELLLTTPLSEHDIPAGHLLALKRRVVRAFSFLIFLGAFYLMLLCFTLPTGQMLLIALGYFCALLFQIFEMSVNARQGLWKGLQWGQSSNAFRRTFGVSGVACLIVLLLAGVIAFTLAPTLPKDAILVVGAIAAAFALLAAMAAMFAHASARLADDFRTVAATPGPPK